MPSAPALATMGFITHVSLSKEKGEGGDSDGSEGGEGEEDEEEHGGSEDGEDGVAVGGGFGAAGAGAGPGLFQGLYKSLLQALEALPGPIQGVDLGCVCNQCAPSATNCILVCRCRVQCLCSA